MVNLIPCSPCRRGGQVGEALDASPTRVCQAAEEIGRDREEMHPFGRASKQGGQQWVLHQPPPDDRGRPLWAGTVQVSSWTQGQFGKASPLLYSQAALQCLSYRLSFQVYFSLIGILANFQFLECELLEASFCLFGFLLQHRMWRHGDSISSADRMSLHVQGFRGERSLSGWWTEESWD